MIMYIVINKFVEIYIQLLIRQKLLWQQVCKLVQTHKFFFCAFFFVFAINMVQHFLKQFKICTHSIINKFNYTWQYYSLLYDPSIKLQVKGVKAEYGSGSRRLNEQITQKEIESDIKMIVKKF